MSVSPDADPSGFLERAPRLAELLPDAALSAALGRGDVWAVHQALRRRLEREPPGPTRELLAALVADRSAFVVAGRPPSLGTVLGTGIRFQGRPRPGVPDAPFVATRTFAVLGVPLWPLDEHLVRRSADGLSQVIGQVPSRPGLGLRRVASVATVVLVLCLGVGLSATVSYWRRVRHVQVINGLSRPVEVRIADKRWVMAPGGQEEGNVLREDGQPLMASATWPGEAQPFELVALRTDGATSVFNVLGAALLMARPADREDPQGHLSEPLPGPTGALTGEQRLEVLEKGWERVTERYADGNNGYQAGALARGVALADPLAVRARELAALFLLQSGKVEAAAFAWELARRWPDDVPAQELAQDVLAAVGQRPKSVEHYDTLARNRRDSVEAAVLAQRARGGLAGAEHYADILERFPESAMARLALARALLLTQSATEVREVLKPLEDGVPERLEDLELQVRVLVGARRPGQAATLVRRYGQDVRRRTWDFLVLAGRVAEVAGPAKTPYVLRDWIPSELARDGDRMVLLSLLTGQRVPKDAELAAMRSPTERAVATLTRDLLTKPEAAVQAAMTAKHSVLERLDPEVTAILAMELAHREFSSADRLLGASLPLLLARESLVDYARTGVEGREFQQLSPGLRGAAYLARVARGSFETRRVAEPEAYKRAQETDVLGGMVPRAARAWYGTQVSEPPPSAEAELEPTGRLVEPTPRSPSPYPPGVLWQIHGPHSHDVHGVEVVREPAASTRRKKAAKPVSGN